MLTFYGLMEPCGTCRLSSLRILCLSLLWSQHTTASQAVSLTCNKTVEVEAGEAVALNCSIGFDLDSESRCTGVEYRWSNTSGSISCNTGLMKYTCEWNNLTYVSLIISDVTEQENYTVSIITNCGLAQASVSVQVKHYNINGGDKQETNKAPENSNKWLQLWIVSCFFFVVAAAVVVVAVVRKMQKSKDLC